MSLLNRIEKDLLLFEQAFKREEVRRMSQNRSQGTCKSIMPC
jgi:hypothetical protein